MLALELEVHTPPGSKGVTKGVAKDVVLALICIALTILFNIATIWYVDPAKFGELQRGQTKLIQFLGVPFDLWIVAFSLLVGANVGTPDKPEQSPRLKKLNWALALTGGVFIAVLACLALSAILPTLYPNWIKIYVPDLLGFGLVGYAANSAREGT